MKIKLTNCLTGETSENETFPELHPVHIAELKEKGSVTIGLLHYQKV